MAESALLTVAEASSLLRLKISTVRAWVLKRKISYVKIGSRVLFRKSDIDALVSRSVVPAVAPTQMRSAECKVHIA